MTAAAVLRVSREAHVLTLTLDAPGGNLVSLDVLEQLRSTLLAARGDDALRVLVVGASGTDFCLGANLLDPRLVAMVTGGEQTRRELARLGQEVVDELATFPVPTVVSARGRILGAGACFFTACDFRFASTDAVLGFPEVDRAMHLSWGILPRMVEAYGQATAKRLALLGRPLSVETLGDAALLASDPDAEARAMAMRLADKPPLAVRAIVEVLRTGDSSRDPELFASTAASADFLEAMSAFMQKRAPTFRGR